jgi:hypothetical protein
VDLPAAAANAPTAALAAVPAVTTDAASVPLAVTYTGSAAAILASTIGTGNLTVTGPAGSLTVAAATASANADSLTAPAGGFTSADDGTYTVSLVGGQVTDTAGNAAAAQALRTFVVDIPPAATPVTSAVTLSIPVASVDSGNLVTLTATAGSVDGTTRATPTGSVSFYAGTTLLGTSALAEGTSSLSTAALPTGAEAITAVCSGDPTFTAATSAAVNITVLGPAAGAAVLTPSLTRAVLPAAVVAGASHRITIPVTVTNTGGLIERGTVHVNVYAVAGTTLAAGELLLSSTAFRVSIKPGRSVTLTVRLAGPPATTPAGTYHLLTQLVDASGFAQTAATSATVTVAAPFVRPVVSILRGPATGIAAKKERAPVVIAIANTGNVAITGPVTITVYLTATGLVDARSIAVTTIKKKANIPAGKSAKLSIGLGTLSSTLSGTYQLAAVVQTSPSDGAPAASATGIGPASIVITALVV